MELHKFNPGKRVIGAVMGILFLSVLAFSFLIINWPQESPYRSVTIQIPKGSTVSDVSRILKEKKIITNERVFRMAVRALGYDKRLPAGSYSINGAKSNYQIIQQLVYGAPNLKRLTVLEGWKINDIAAEIEMVLGTEANAFLDLCTKKSLLKKWNIAHDSFEGFLLPDTYYFMENEKPVNILKKMVQEYHSFMSEELRDRARKLGLKELEVITLASIIEGEALFNEERPIISGVYHNRLQKRMKLQADPTIQYIIKDGPRRLLNNDLKIKSPYNTYMNKGLPPGPINNPGKESIMAALFPNENEYLYFVARGDGFHKFSKTEEEHLIAKRKFQKIRRQVRRKAKTNKANS